MYTIIIVLAATIAGYAHDKTVGESKGFNDGYETARGVYMKALSERMEELNKLP